ncbi:MAG TPA: putative peptidoglycan glycosyltransferase FtsW [Bryobacteraceae bacterium]|jgi:cell division protein FtsW|nr:putative peptidoglycan glycosyltransferase FtsW [Bryobacteraceae bacterium]
MSQRLKTDWILFATVLLLACFGVVMLYSASSIMAAVNPRFHWSWYFVVRQVAFAVPAVAIMMALKATDYRKYNNSAVAFGMIGIALVLLAAVYFVDTAHHRWLRFFGPFEVQPSELAKPALVIFLAFFVAWRGRAINNPRHTLFPAALAVGLVIFAVVVADLGTAVVLGLTAATVFFVAGLQPRYCAIVAFMALLGVAVFVYRDPYRLGRVVRFFDPQYRILTKIDRHGTIRARMEQSLTTRDTNYQLQQSKIAIGEGGPVGLGLMNGKQKLLYLPEAHTDFIYAVVGEELGLAGSAGVLLCFGVIFWRGLRAAWRMGDDFGRYLALGATVVVVSQAFINMFSVLGMMPTKGIALPLISYGGSSLVTTLALLGILMNVAEHVG